jgi:hypothetical protein
MESEPAARCAQPERFQADWKTGGSDHCHCEEHLRRGNLLAAHALDRIAASQSGSSQ